MKIKAINKRPLTVLDFKEMSKVEPFSSWRRVSKTINFSMIFGCAASRFALELENKGYTEEECDLYLELTNSTHLYNEALSKNLGKMEPKKVKYLVAATLMREAYFKTYSGLQERIVREQNFARKHGYVRAWHGPVRRLPELALMKFNSSGNLIGADKKLYSKLASSLANIACNSTIQTMEARVAFATIRSVNEYLREWNMKSFLWNFVHDSLDGMVWKPELELYLSLIGECAGWIREPDRGVHMCVDHNVADLSKGLEHNYYKAGVENGVPVLPIQEALDNYNMAMGTDYKWHGCFN